MRAHATATAASLLPEPGTTEAIELGCTCRSIGHAAATGEPDANCPLLGTAAQAGRAD